MNSADYPRLSVTLSIFTAFDSQHAKRPSAAHLSQGDGGKDDFGMGLWVLTRKSNEEESYQRTPRGTRVIPGSLVRSEEALSDTAQRILVEELGVDVSYRLRQNRIFDDVNPEATSRVIAVNFWTFVHIEALAPLLGGKEQVGLELVSSSASLENWAALTDIETFDGVSRFGLRFGYDQPNAHVRQTAAELWGQPILDDSGDDMVFYAWRDMRYGFTGRFDPFRFMGSQALGTRFRLSELRSLYEVVRGQKIQADQFRRMTTGSSGFIDEAGSIDSSRSRPGKPATLYKLKEWAVPKTGFIPAA